MPSGFDGLRDTAWDAANWAKDTAADAYEASINASQELVYKLCKAGGIVIDKCLDKPKIPKE